MLEQIKEKIESLELYATNFISPKKGTTFIKEKLTDLVKSGINLPFKFDYLLVTMSKNGGLIALCKIPNYFDQHKTKINTDIIVMHQNAGKRYYIPIDWKYNDSYIVSLEFNSKEQLYAFCHNGDLRKIDILTNKVKVKVNSGRFLDEGIVKAKLFEKGFIALTRKSNVYYAPDIKDPKPYLLVNIKEKFNFSDDIEFLGIPASNTASKKEEFLILSDKGEGVVHIFEVNTNLGPGSESKIDRNREYKTNVIGPEEVIKEKLPEFEDIEIIDNPNEAKKKKMLKISAMCISPDGEEIAFYSGSNSTIYLSSSSNLAKFSPKKIKLSVDKIKQESIDEEVTKDMIGEYKSLFSFDNKKYKFLFCGNTALALCSQRFLILCTKNGDLISFRISEENSIKAIEGGPLFHAITEVDGIRTYSKEGIYLISEVSEDVINVCDPFSKHPSKNLLNAYGYYLSKNANCDKIIRDIATDLPKAINTLQKAAMNLFFIEDNEENSNMKELQMFLIKAAQYGKSFVQKGDFNYESFLQRCKELRVINSLRNLKNAPRYLTYQEYNDMNPFNPNNFIKLIMRYHNYRFAFELSNYLGYDPDTVYLGFCGANIRKLEDDNNTETIFEEFQQKLAECPNISYINLSKKCIKHSKYKLAEKFLEHEKSIVVKVPQYLQLRNWNKALDLAIESNDRTVIKVVIDKIFKVEQEKDFIRIVGKKPKAHRAVIDYLKMHELTDQLKQYLISKKDYEELLFINLENFFKCKSLDGRKKFIQEANEYVKDMKGMPNFEFYKNYLNDLNFSLKFKKTCIDENFIASTDISPFDNSIFDCYKLGIDKGFESAYKIIEDGNKQFNIGQKKITYIKFKKWAEKRNFEKIENDVTKNGYKKLDISPLIVAKIFFDVKNYDLATKYIKDKTDFNDFDEKIKLLKKMSKYEDAIEIIMKNKKADKEQYLNEILREKPELKSYIENFGKK